MSVSLLQIPQLRELEEKYARILGPGVLMERAGKAAAEFISDLYPAPARVTVVCGPGNNGGDGYRTAIELLNKEYDVNVVQVAGKAPKSEEAKAALAEWEKLGRTVYTDPYDTPKADIVVDAIFGIGLERPLKDEFLDAAMWFNERRALHVSLDIPSGLNSETGTWVGDRAGCKADATISFLSGKVGLFTGLGPDACGVTWRLFSSIRQVFSRPVFWLLKAAAVTAVCFATSTAIASCRTLNLKRKNLPLVMLFPVVWKNVLLRARALRAASVNTSGSTSRCSVKTTLNTTFVKFTKSAITSSALTRRRIGSRFARLSTTPWAVSAPTRTANLRL